MATTHPAPIPRTMIWLLIVSIALPGCALMSKDPPRTTETFCSTMKAEQARIRRELQDASDAMDSSGDDLASVLIGMGSLGRAAGELRTYFLKLSKVAPPEIQTEVEVIAKTLDEQIDKSADVISDPLGSLASTVMSGITVSGELERVSQYAHDHCGQGI